MLPNRAMAVDFSRGVGYGFTAVVIPLETNSNMWYITGPFTNVVWLLIVTSIPLYIVAMALAYYLYNGSVDWDSLSGFVIRNGFRCPMVGWIVQSSPVQPLSNLVQSKVDPAIQIHLFLASALQSLGRYWRGGINQGRGQEVHQNTAVPLNIFSTTSPLNILPTCCQLVIHKASYLTKTRSCQHLTNTLLPENLFSC